MGLLLVFFFFFDGLQVLNLAGVDDLALTVPVVPHWLLGRVYLHVHYELRNLKVFLALLLGLLLDFVGGAVGVLVPQNAVDEGIVDVGSAVIAEEPAAAGSCKSVLLGLSFLVTQSFLLSHPKEFRNQVS